MDELRITLIGDGQSDRALAPVIKWLADDIYPHLPNTISFAEFGRIPNPPANGDVQGRISCAQEYYPCDLIVYHRDAETNNPDTITQRKNEVMAGLEESVQETVVCVIPVRMMETWLLIDKEAIKYAAGNRHYKGALELPPIQKLEKVSAPKEVLDGLVKKASNLSGRKLAKLRVRSAVHDIANYIEDFSPLRQLNAFQTFERDFRAQTEAILNHRT